MSDLPAGDAALKHAPVSLLLLVALAGCDGPSSVCTMEMRPGLQVTITDSTSGEPRAGAALAIARDGAYADTLDPGVSNGDVMITRQGAYERQGIYDVVVRAPGYRDWIQQGVMVRSGQCHVSVARLEAKLQP